MHIRLEDQDNNGDWRLYQKVFNLVLNQAISDGIKIKFVICDPKELENLSCSSAEIIRRTPFTWISRHKKLEKINPPVGTIHFCLKKTGNIWLMHLWKSDPEWIEIKDPVFIENNEFPSLAHDGKMIFL